MSVSKEKLRILSIMKILMDNTNENNIMSAADLIRELGDLDISAERKTIYGDIETLMEFGLDIIQVRGGSKSGYYIGSRDFEIPELKLLVDAVQSSKFITTKKSQALIEKIEKLASKDEAKQLQRNVFILNRSKTANENIYYNVDQINEAISRNSQITFQYNKWNLDKELTPKRDGAFYKVSPWALTWDDENYYLIAWEEEPDCFNKGSKKIKHYRVDKMTRTSILPELRKGKEEFENFDLGIFSKKTFGMYGGNDRKVTLLCKKDLIGVILDRFSKDVIVVPNGNDYFKVTVEVAISNQFFGWITGIGEDIHIEGPTDIKGEYVNFLRKILYKY